MNRTPPVVTNEAIAAAVDWQVRLTSGHAAQGEREAFAHWLAADLRHQAAWQKVAGVLMEPVQQIRGLHQCHPGQLQAVHQSLATPVSVRRRNILGGAAVMLVAGAGAGYLAHRVQPMDELLADLQTGTAETRHLALLDGSGLDLNARSAVDLRFTETQRLVHLRAGELLVRVARDAGARSWGSSPPRPFIVQTRHGTAQAMGTRYLVRQEEARSLVVVLEHSVFVQTGDGVRRVLQEGQSAWLDGNGIELVDQPMGHRARWTEGLLDVRDESLGDVIDALRPWRKGLIRISPAAARLRVFGVFRLNDSQKTLQALVDTQPTTVTTYGPMLTVIDVR